MSVQSGDRRVRGYRSASSLDRAMVPYVLPYRAALTTIAPSHALRLDRCSGFAARPAWGRCNAARTADRH